jgi:Taurine catabolism dioxygenase TauD, TfdA family
VSAARNKVTTQLHGDGTPIPEKYFAHLARITDEIRVLHRWQEGDVLVYAMSLPSMEDSHGRVNRVTES